MVLGQNTQVSELSLLLKDTQHGALEFGTDEAYLDNLPPMEAETSVTPGYLWSDYDASPVVVNGELSYNTVLVLKATAPRPCTVLGAVVTVE